MNPEAYLESLSDTQLIKEFHEAKNDLEIAAATERNSEWHEACFAVVFIFATEIEKRGIDMRTLN